VTDAGEESASGFRLFLGFLLGQSKIIVRPVAGKGNGEDLRDLFQILQVSIRITFRGIREYDFSGVSSIAPSGNPKEILGYPGVHRENTTLSSLHRFVYVERSVQPPVVENLPLLFEYPVPNLRQCTDAAFGIAAVIEYPYPARLLDEDCTANTLGKE
jgi:hypothetical protein